MEGVNLGAILLAYLGAIVLGVAALAALGLWAAGKAGAARLTFASGLLATALIATVATLSYLQKGYGFHAEGSEPMLALMALSLFLAGVGQFVAAVRHRRYAASLGCASAALVIVLGGPFLGADVVGGLGHRLVGSGLPLAVVSLVPAVASLVIGCLPRRPA